MSRTIDIALFGAAHPHVAYVLDELPAWPGVRVAAVCEADPARRAELERRTGAPGYADPLALLDRHPVRAAAVVTEFGGRGPLVAELARRGILAIVDKPLCTSEADLDAIEAALAGRDGIALMLEKRFYPVTLALRAILAAGDLGEVVTMTATGPHKLRPAGRPPWMFDPARYGGLLADLTVHDIDLALSLVGSAGGGTVSGWVSPVACPGTAAFPAAGRALLTTATGLQVGVEVDWIQPDASPRHGDYALRVSGTRGRADVLFAENRLVVETETRAAHAVALPPGETPAAFAFRHLVTGGPLAVPSREALRATRIALLAQRSARSGGVPLPWVG